MNEKNLGKAEEELKKVLEKEEIGKEKRLDAIVDMQRSLYLTKMRYYIFSVVALIVVIAITGSLFTVSFVEALILFVAGLFGIRYFFINKIFLKKYNEHAEKINRIRATERDWVEESDKKMAKYDEERKNLGEKQ